MSSTNTILTGSVVTTYETLTASLAAEIQWHVVSAGQDGISQMPDLLWTYAELDSMHVMSHVAIGALHLGSTALNSSNISSDQIQRQTIGSGLAETGDIVLYGGDVAQGDVQLDATNALSGAGSLGLTVHTGASSPIRTDQDRISALGLIGASVLRVSAALGQIGLKASEGVFVVPDSPQGMSYGDQAVRIQGTDVNIVAPLSGTGTLELSLASQSEALGDLTLNTARVVQTVASFSELPAAAPIVLGDVISVHDAIRLDATEIGLLSDGFERIVIGSQEPTQVLWLGSPKAGGVWQPLVFKDPLVLVASGVAVDATGEKLAAGHINIEGVLLGQGLTIFGSGSTTYLDGAHITQYQDVVINDNIVVLNDSTIEIIGPDAVLQIFGSVLVKAGVTLTLSASELRLGTYSQRNGSSGQPSQTHIAQSDSVILEAGATLVIGAQRLTVDTELTLDGGGDGTLVLRGAPIYGQTQDFDVSAEQLDLLTAQMVDASFANITVGAATSTTTVRSPSLWSEQAGNVALAGTQVHLGAEGEKAEWQIGSSTHFVAIDGDLQLHADLLASHGSHLSLESSNGSVRMSAAAEIRSQGGQVTIKAAIGIEAGHIDTSSADGFQGAIELSGGTGEDKINLVLNANNVDTGDATGSAHVTSALQSGKIDITTDDGNDFISIDFALGNPNIDGGDGDDYINVRFSSKWVDQGLEGGSGNDASPGESGTGLRGSTLTGGKGNDSLLGSSGDDNLSGDDGDDLIEGSPGDDTISGGEGTDVAVFIGRRADYTITWSASTSSFSVASAAEGIDSLSSIETLTFSDGSYDAGALQNPNNSLIINTDLRGGLTGFIRILDAPNHLRDDPSVIASSIPFRNVLDAETDDIFMILAGYNGSPTGVARFEFGTGRLVWFKGSFDLVPWVPGYGAAEFTQILLIDKEVFLSADNGLQNQFIKLDRDSGEVISRQSLDAHAEIQSTGDGGIYAPIGYPNSDGIVIKKFDANLNVEWQKRLSSDFYDQVIDSTVDPNGNLVVGGSARSNSSTANNGSFLAKLSSDGNILWTLFGLDPNYGSVNDIAIDERGFIYACGYTYHPDGSSSLGQLICVNSDGDLIWEKYLRPNDVSTQLQSVVIDHKGNIIVGGVAHGGDTLVLAKFGNNGDQLWTQVVKSPANLSRVNLKIEFDNSISLITANYDGSGDKLFGTSVKGKMFVLQFGTEGEIFGTVGSDSIDGTNKADTVIVSDGDDTVYGLGGDDLLNGGYGNDSLEGGDGADFLYGGTGADVLQGGKGNDKIKGGDGKGDDVYDGGDGTDQVTYSSALAPILVDLSAGVARSLGSVDANIGNDTLINIEDVLAGPFEDSIVGSFADNVLDGAEGDDTLTGGGGNDTLSGGAGTDAAVFIGRCSDYTITWSASTSSFSVASAAEGIDSLSSIETLTFSDGSYVASALQSPDIPSAPTASTFSPADEATAVAIGANVVVTFSEAIQRGAGSIFLKKADGTTVATYAQSSTEVTVSGSTLTINPASDLAYGTGYSVEFAAGSVQDLAGNNYAGTSSYNFTTSEPATINVVVTPAAVAESGSANLVYTLSRTGDTSSALTVDISLSGTATESDYTSNIMLVSGSEPFKAWTKLLGTSGYDFGSALTTGLDGSIYVGGGTDGALDGQTNNGGYDAFLTKYSADGTKAWTRLLGTSGSDSANALTTGLDGSIYVSGFTRGALDGQTYNGGSSDVFLTKYSADGTKAWTKLLGTTGSESAFALTTGLDGSIYVTGITDGALDEQTYNGGSYDAFLTKYSADGTKAWTKLLGTSGADYAEALTTGLDGSIYVSGDTVGALDGQTNSGNGDAFLTKYSADGTKAWTKLLGTSSDDSARALTTGLDGSIYVSGQTLGALDGQTNRGSSDVFLTKYSADGTKAWTKRLGSSGADFAEALTTGLDGSIYVSGLTRGALDGQTNNGGSDAFLTKYSADGTKAWTKLLGTSSGDDAVALTTGLDGSIYVSGNTGGALDGRANSGNDDAFLTKFSESPQITFPAGASSATLVIDPIADSFVEGNETLTVTVLSGTGYNSGNSVFATGTIDDTAPTLAVNSFSPADEATAVAIGANVVVTFSEAIQRGAGSIVLKKADGTTVATYAQASTEVTVSGSTLTINPASDLAYGTGYSVEFAAGSVQDLAGNNYAGTSSYNFATGAAPDTTAPTVLWSDNQPGSLNRTTATVVYSLSFSEPVTGLTVSDFVVNKGQVASVTGSGSSWNVTINIFDATDGRMEITLKAGAVSDGTGNTNLAATDSSQAIDTLTPAAPTLKASGISTPLIDPRVKFDTTLGSFVLELDPDLAPFSANNLLSYAARDFYDGTIFHRIVNDAPLSGMQIVQGGGFTPGLIQKSTGAAIPLESSNGLSNVRGTVAMARTNQPNSGTSQFYINVDDNLFLDYQSQSNPGYAVFGRVVEGMGVLDQMLVQPLKTVGNFGGVPATDIVVSQANIVQAPSTVYSRTGLIDVGQLEAGAKLYYSIDGGVTVMQAPKGEISVPAGTYYVGNILTQQVDAAGNLSNLGMYGRNLVVDSTAPTALTFSPADEATAVAIGANVVVTFSEAIQRGAGSIVLKKADGTTVATYAQSSTEVTVSGSTLTINPASDLSHSTTYKVEFATGSVQDLAGNDYVETSAYNFTTNYAPIANPASITTQEDTATTGTLTGTDLDGHKLTFTKIADPSHGTIVIDSTTGAYSYTPALNYQGSDSFSFKVNDGALDSAVATVLINVAPMADITGRVYHWKSHWLLQGVQIADGATTATTDANGNFHLKASNSASVLLTPALAVQGLGSSIDSSDALAALKIAAGRNPNADGSPVTPYQFIAADINEDGVVTSSDALAIMKMSLNRTDAPMAKWLFVNESEDFWNEAINGFTTSRKSVVYDQSIDVNAQQDVNLNLVAVLKGDVNGNWAAAASTPDLDTFDPNYFAELSSRLGSPQAQWGIII